MHVQAFIDGLGVAVVVVVAVWWFIVVAAAIAGGRSHVPAVIDGSFAV